MPLEQMPNMKWHTNNININLASDSINIFIVMMFFKLLFWYCIFTNNAFYMQKLCYFDWFYELVKIELQDSGFYDADNYPSKDFVISCAKIAFCNIKDLELPHYSYVYKYYSPMGDTTTYYVQLVAIDKMLDTCEKKINYAINRLDKEDWQGIKNYLKFTRKIYDKLDDVSRPVIPLWQKRIYLANIKSMLDHEDYDHLDEIPCIPFYSLPKID